MARASRSRRRSRYSSRSVGHERARQHIEDARRLSQELGGTDQDVKAYFFALPEEDLNIILDLYQSEYGVAPREYAQATIGRWRAGKVQMSGTVAERLFKILPKVMPLAAKYRLTENLWAHVGPSSKKILLIGLDANVNDVCSAVRRHMDEVITSYKIPEPLEKRFDWLSGGDVHVKQQLLNYLRQMEKLLVEQSARAQLPVMLNHLLSPEGDHTKRLAQVLRIGKHELALTLDRSCSGVSLVDPQPIRSAVNQGQGKFGSWLWVILIVVGVLIYLVTRNKR